MVRCWKWSEEDLVKAELDTPVISPGRRLDPEWLDELPPEDPRAVGSRKDLRRLNRIMSHVPFLADVWRRNRPDRWIETIVELGAGDGTFLLEFARANSRRNVPSPAPNSTIVSIQRSGLFLRHTSARNGTCDMIRLSRRKSLRDPTARGSSGGSSSNHSGSRRRPGEITGVSSSAFTKSSSLQIGRASCR